MCIQPVYRHSKTSFFREVRWHDCWLAVFPCNEGRPVSKFNSLLDFRWKSVIVLTYCSSCVPPCWAPSDSARAFWGDGCGATQIPEPSFRLPLYGRQIRSPTGWKSGDYLPSSHWYRHHAIRDHRARRCMEKEKERKWNQVWWLRLCKPLADRSIRRHFKAKCQGSVSHEPLSSYMRNFLQ